jgi:hypothetical protein
MEAMAAGPCPTLDGTRMHTLVKGDRVEKQGMPEATRNVLEECRMVLPGIQALFGFQLVAVVEPPFFEILGRGEQIAHLVALAMTAVAIALVMAPAAYHRQVHPEAVSNRHLRVSSIMLTIGMLPLMLAIGIDVYIVARVVSRSVAAAALVAGLVGCVFVGLWIVLPCVARLGHRGGIYERD